ncbi:MAG TPA: glucose-6-phosphate isomerase [Gemmatimonadales bacterium]|nr:glucose-6-phosphate isomerase [Gemmatimonadales bacterium]
MKLHYGKIFTDKLDGEHGLPRIRLDDLAQRFSTVLGEVRSRRRQGEYGFYELGEQSKTVTAIRRFAEGIGQAYDHVLVLGIGGSALGTKALVNALRPAAWNELDDEAREFFPRITLLENVDPGSIAAALRRIDPRRVFVNVISKSGGTAETLAQYLVVRAWLDEALGQDAAVRHIAFTTDPSKGPLRAIAEREGIAALEIPPAVGGRYSVLTPVGLLPAALVGIDVSALVAGARRAVDRADVETLLQNPAALYAALHWAADAWLGARIHVLMPYSDRLKEFAAWYVQLWAESLGKRVDRRGEVVHAGPTPLGAIGVTDQHSQVQLFMEGPFDKLVSFIRIEHPDEELTIPSRPGLPEELAYLSGHTLGELLLNEQEATSAALARSGRMNVTLSLPALSAETVGELIMFFQIATGFAGVWYGVDPFDQPGVELGKRLTFAAMGRAGFSKEPAPGAAGPEDVSE